MIGTRFLPSAEFSLGARILPSAELSLGARILPSAKFLLDADISAYIFSAYIFYYFSAFLLTLTRMTKDEKGLAFFKGLLL